MLVLKMINQQSVIVSSLSSCEAEILKKEISIVLKICNPFFFLKYFFSIKVLRGIMTRNMIIITK